jgi:general secretion pathway protein D
MNRRFARLANISVLLGMLLGMLLSSGCRSLRDRLRADAAAEEPDDYRKTAEAVLKSKPVKSAEPYDNDPIVVDKVAPEDTVKLEEKVVFPENREVAYPKVSIAEYPQTLIKGILEPDKEVEVKLNLDEASLQEIVPMFAELLNFSYQLDPSLKGSVTMHVESKMTAREAWEMFEHILWLGGAYASKNPGFIHVVPFAKMPKERRLLVRHEPLANVEVAFIPIYYVKSADIIKNIQPFMTDGATVTDLGASNTLLIVEAPANMPKLRELISRLDNKGEAAWPHTCIQCNEVSAEDLQDELEQLLPVLGYPVTSKGPSGGQIKLTSLPRLETIVVSAALPEVLKEVERWAKVLDRGDSESKEDVFFYDVQHSTAEKLNEMLQVFFNTDSTTSTSKSTSQTKSTSAKATATTGSQPATTSRTTNANSKRSSRNNSDEKSDNIFDTPVVVYVDQDNNRLSMKTTRRAFSLIKAMLERHDINPRLVLVEAKIVEVSLGKSTQYGFAYAVQHTDWQAAMNQMGTDGTGAAIEPWTDSGTNWSGKTPVTGLYPGNPASFTTTAGGVALGYLKGDSMAFVNAVAGQGNSKVLSAPQIMATNGVEGEINIGRRIAVKTNEYNSSDYKVSYDYIDVGTILTVTPYITAGNDVRLEIVQEVSSVIDGTGGENSPDISNKKLRTTLIIPSGGTAIMGGLIDTSNSQGHTGVPLLKDIPMLGHLFRTNQQESSRNELLVLISVEVLDARSDTTPLLKRYHQALREIQEQLD